MLRNTSNPKIVDKLINDIKKYNFEELKQILPHVGKLDSDQIFSIYDAALPSEDYRSIEILLMFLDPTVKNNQTIKNAIWRYNITNGYHDAMLVYWCVKTLLDDPRVNELAKNEKGYEKLTQFINDSSYLNMKPYVQSHSKNMI